MSSPPELEVVCSNCGEQVSPYVTECPYCGTRIRKRAPKLERSEEGLRIREPRRKRRRRERASAKRPRRAGVGQLAQGRPVATLALLAAPALLLIVQRAAGLSPIDVGAIVAVADGPATEPWRFVAAPFVYDDMGYLFAAGLAIAIFAPGIERRLGSIATLCVLVGSAALGALAADALAGAGLDDGALIAGGNGMALAALAAWTALRHAESRAGGEDWDAIGVAVAAVAILALPLVESSASPIAGLVAGVVGGAAGWIAAAVGATEPR